MEDEENEGLLMKLSKVITQGRSIEGRLKELDMEADSLLKTGLTDELTGFQESLSELESDSVKMGSEELFSSLKSLREMNSHIIDTYSKMNQYTVIMIKQMKLEVSWIKVFERFEVQAEKFYRFAKQVRKNRLLTPAIEDRVQLATKKIAVGMGLLHKGHVNIANKFVTIDSCIPKDKDTLEKYHAEFMDRRRKVLQQINPKAEGNQPPM